VAFQVLDAGQLAYQLLGLVDQDGEVLRADPVLLVLKLDGQQGYFLLAALAYQAAVLVIDHDELL
jgi:hypothetical protein